MLAGALYSGGWACRNPAVPLWLCLVLEVDLVETQRRRSLRLGLVLAVAAAPFLRGVETPAPSSQHIRPSIFIPALNHC